MRTIDKGGSRISESCPGLPSPGRQGMERKTEVLLDTATLGRTTTVVRNRSHIDDGIHDHTERL